MGKGGPLAFLNKKPWHPGNIQNQEEIWKREQAFLAEVEKREELKRQIEDEREAEDNVTQFQREKLGDQRVEWMYQGGFAAREDAEKKKEEYLMGKAVDKLPDHGPEEAASRVDEVAAGSMPTSAKQFSGNETWSRLNADPMLTMKRVELDKLKKAQENAKIARLQAQIQLKAAAKLTGKDSKSKKHKKDKKHKKEKKDKGKHKSKRQRRDDGSQSSDSRSPSPLPPPPPRTSGHDQAHAQQQSTGSHKRPREPSRDRDTGPRERDSYDRPGYPPAPREAGREAGEVRYGRPSTPSPDDRHHDRNRAVEDASCRHSDGDALRHRTHSSHARHSEGAEREQARDGHGGRDSEREKCRDGGTNGRADYTYDRHASERDGYERRHNGGQHKSRNSSADEPRSHDRTDRSRDVRDSSRDHGRDNGRYNVSSKQNERDSGRGDRRERDSGRDARAANEHRRDGYGLVSAHVPEFAKHSHRDDTELTKRALEERVAARENEEREEAERASAARRKYRPGALTEEEKERKRSEMMGNAADVQDMRMGLLRRAHDEDVADERREGRDTEEYLRSEERRMLLASSAVTSIGEKRR